MKKVDKEVRCILVLGDWSDDGHGKSAKVELSSNLPVAVIQRAYKDSCKLTGVALNHNEDYTGKAKDLTREQREKLCIATEYENSTISKEAFEALAKFGLTMQMLKEWNEDEGLEDDEALCLFQSSFVPFWIWFTCLSNKELILKVVPEHDLPVINGYWDKHLNVQFGYGLYS